MRRALPVKRRSREAPAGRQAPTGGTREPQAASARSAGAERLGTSLALVVVGCAVGGLILVQDAVPWPVTPKELIHGRAPLSLSGEWEGRPVRLEGLASYWNATEGHLDERAGRFVPIVEEWRSLKEGMESIFVFTEASSTLGQPEDIPTRARKFGPTQVSIVGRVTRAPEEVVARFSNPRFYLDFPGRVCVDATAPRATWRSLVGLAVILWGFYIMGRSVKRERAKKPEEAAPSTQESGK